MRAIVRLSGGIGNQFFQIGYGDFLNRIHGFEVSFDISTFENITSNSTHRLFRGNHFYPNGVYGNFGADVVEKQFGAISEVEGKPLTKQVLRGILLCRYFFREKKVIHFRYRNPIIWSVFGNSLSHVFIGSWQDSKFVSHEFRRLITKEMNNLFKHQEFVFDSNLIGLHVRRGDYLHPLSIHLSLTNDYYKNAISWFMNSNPSGAILVFSDCNVNELEVDTLGAKTFSANVHTIDDLAQIHMLSRLSKVIVANSTFSVMAALIGLEDKQVIAPRNWYKKGVNAKSPVLPISWKYL